MSMSIPSSTIGRSTKGHPISTCLIKYDIPAKAHRMTPIICSIGPATRHPEVIEKMIMAGMDICRFDCRRDNRHELRESIKMVQETAEKCSFQLGYDVMVAIAVDIHGPDIYTGLLEGGIKGEFDMHKGETIRLSINRGLYDKGNRECIYIDYHNIINLVQPGSTVLVDKGLIKMRVKEVTIDAVICTVEIGGHMRSRRIVHLPDVEINLPYINDRDRDSVLFAVHENADFIIAGKARSGACIAELRHFLAERSPSMKIIAKIENLQGLRRIDEIIAAADAIVISRKDLCCEMSVDKMLLVRKTIVARCIRTGKPVIMSTNIFDSMRTRLTPLFAEICALGNAVVDGVNCIMLMAETTVGQHPVETFVKVDNVCRESEEALKFGTIYSEILTLLPRTVDPAHALAISTIESAKKAMTAVIIVLTNSGKSANILSKYRPPCPVLAVTCCARSARQMLLLFGIFPIYYTKPRHQNWIEEHEARIHYALTLGKKKKFLKKNDPIAIWAPVENSPGFNNNLRIIHAFHEPEKYPCLLNAVQIEDDKAEKEGQTKKPKQETTTE